MQQDNHPIEVEGESRAVSADLDLLTAAGLAADGDLDEAEAVLSRTGADSRSVDATELLARIAVQKGEWHRAQQLLATVLEKDPSRASAQRALSRMRSPWLVYAVVRRMLYLCALGLIGCLSVAGIVALVHYDRWGASPVVEPATATPPATETTAAALPQSEPKARVDVPLATQPVEPARSPDEGVVPKHPPPPLFAIPGCSVTTNATETRVCFEEGLFAYRAEFTESGRKQLEAAAREAACHTNGFWIVVEGHTDSDPMPPNSTYKDNYALGLHRAMVAVEVIKSATSVSGRDILGVSAGESVPPFSENDYDSKLRNRTVVVRLVPKMRATLRRSE
jgi:outer membrane protein OmpA-like peptidoglycan-associated protein